MTTPIEEISVPEKDEDGFISASKFNHRNKKTRKTKTNRKLEVKRLVDSNGKKMTFTNFLLSFIPNE